MSSAKRMTSYYTKDNKSLESTSYPKVAEFLIFKSGPCMYGVSILL